MSEDPRRQHIEFNLRYFLTCVERGGQPPDWLMKFMADGAREFLRGGKPWQKGKGGAPKKYNRDNQVAFLLMHVAKMKISEILDVMGIACADGTDQERTMYRNIKRGEKDLGINPTDDPFPPFGANETQYLNFKDALDDLLSGSVADLGRYPKALDKLKSIKRKIEAAEADWSQEPRFF